MKTVKIIRHLWKRNNSLFPRKICNLSGTFFNKTTMATHCELVLDILNAFLQEWVIWNHTTVKYGQGWSWPPQSSDIIICLWACFEGHICNSLHQRATDLASEIYIITKNTGTYILRKRGKFSLWWAQWAYSEIIWWLVVDLLDICTTTSKLHVTECGLLLIRCFT